MTSDFVSEDTLVTQDEVKDGSLGLRTVDVVLDVEGSDLIGRWEALNLTTLKRLDTKLGIEAARNTYPLVMARIKVDLPVPFLPQRP
jgi:hypothetical protein